MMEPRVSVVMITYGHEKYIAEAIHGVLMQACDFTVDLIIANDNSSDNTDVVVTDYLAKKDFPKNISVRYTKHENNKGMMPNFMWAMQQASGKYIALCEGDDYWTDPLKLQKQVDFLENNLDYSFSMGIVDMLIEKTGKTMRRKEHVNPGKNETYTLKDYIKNPFSQTSSFLFRNDRKSFPEWFHNVHAGDQSVVVIKTGLEGKIKYHNELFSVYRLNNRSITYSTNAHVIYEKFDRTLTWWNDYTDKNFNMIIMERKFLNLINWKSVTRSNNFSKFFFRLLLSILRLLKVN